MKRNTIVLIISAVIISLIMGVSHNNNTMPSFTVIKATPAPSTPAPETGYVKETKININTADREELMSLDGIGEVLADRIIEYRNNKAFRNIKEITNVKGIGEKKFAAIRDYITIN